ncbi:MAG: amidohydrolase family protein [Planctomycetes bacterium]|nr:amidohydrolase family protein [Planctomycetota bacterium]
MRRWSLKARLVVPVEGVPVSGAVVDLEGERVTGLRSSGPASIDLGDVAVVPGLVNAHTHLDLSDFAIPVAPGKSFADWIAAVIRHRTQAGSDPARAVFDGIKEIESTATTLLGDISSASDSRAALESSSLDAVVYREVIGVTRERAEASWRGFELWIKDAALHRRIVSGISPHAPYSTQAWLFGKAETNPACQIHIAETREEIDFIEKREGPIADLLQRLGFTDTSSLANSPSAIVKRFPNAIMVHANHLAPQDFKSNRPAIVHCPATHAHFGRRPFPAKQWLDAGFRLALGTDSRASSANLNLGAHLASLMCGPDALDPATVLRCATLNGARALGLQADHGSIRPGKLANLAVVPIGTREDLEAVIGGLAHPVSVLWRGNWRKSKGLANPA